jgi:hypothetical protein
MKRDDIIRMAQEAGFEFNSLGGTYTSGKLDEHLERFAALVAEAEREACKDLWEAQKLTDRQISDHIVAAVAAEREACAKAIEPTDEHRKDASWGYIGGIEGVELLDNAVRAIRARGNT